MDDELFTDSLFSTWHLNSNVTTRKGKKKKGQNKHKLLLVNIKDQYATISFYF
jgi:hypothetical protein